MKSTILVLASLVGANAWAAPSLGSWAGNYEPVENCLVEADRVANGLGREYGFHPVVRFGLSASDWLSVALQVERGPRSGNASTGFSSGFDWYGPRLGRQTRTFPPKLPSWNDSSTGSHRVLELRNEGKTLTIDYRTTSLELPYIPTGKVQIFFQLTAEAGGLYTLEFRSSLNSSGDKSVNRLHRCKMRKLEAGT